MLSPISTSASLWDSSLLLLSSALSPSSVPASGPGASSETFLVTSLPLTVTPTPTPTDTATAPATEPEPAPTVTVTTTAEPAGPSTVVLDGEQFTALTVGLVLAVTFLAAILIAQMRRP